MKWTNGFLGVGLYALSVVSVPAVTAFYEDLNDLSEWTPAFCKFFLNPNDAGSAILSNDLLHAAGKIEAPAGVFSTENCRFLAIGVPSLESGSAYSVFIRTTDGLLMPVCENCNYEGPKVIELAQQPAFPSLQGKTYSIEVWAIGAGRQVILDYVAVRSTPKNTAYVSLSGSDTPPYTTWATAAHDLQQAVTAAGPDGEVVVAPGEYDLTKEIVLDGQTVLRSLEGPAATILDGQLATRCVRLEAHADLPDHVPVLDGFTIKNGYADADWPIGGGGVHCTFGGIVTNCFLFTNSTPASGGGIMIDGGGRVENCVLEGNSAYEGGGIFMYDGLIRNTVVQGNRVQNAGGGLSAWGGRVSGCRAQANTAVLYGGGIYLGTATADCCRIIGNTCDVYSAAGIYVDDNGLCQNSLLCGNRGRQYSAAFLGENARLLNCTVSDNISELWDVFHLSGGSIIQNCIVYYNSESPPVNPRVGLFLNCCINPIPNGQNNVAAEPRFVDRAAGDYRLRADSPCIDAASDGPAYDLQGAGRPLDGDQSGTALPDIGAYEYIPAGLDSDGDGLSNQDEVYVYRTNPVNADTDGDGLNDYQELFIHDTDPNQSDGDHDGYSDGEEVLERDTSPKRYNGRVFAHFMPWFGDNNEYQQLSAHDGLNQQLTAANAYHWRDGYATNGGPIIGEYSCRDPDVCEYHLLTAMASELDGFIVNWRGTNGIPAFLDDGAWALFEKLTDLRARFGGQARFFNLCSLNYDNQPYPTAADFTLDAVTCDFGYLKETFVDAFPNEYFKVWNGDSWQPFISVFLTHADEPLYRAQTIRQAVQAHQLNSHMAWQDPSLEVNPEVDSFYAWVKPDRNEWAADGLNWGRQYLEEDFYGFIGSSLNDKIFTIGGVWPGFDDRHVNWYGPGPFAVGENGKRWMSRQNGDVFRGALDLAVNEFNSVPPVHFIQVVTWNDWNEGTSIEPAGSTGPGAYGYQFADLLRPRAADFRSRRTTNDALGVRMAKDIYFARKTSRDPLYQNAVDEAVRRFLQADYAAAAGVLATLAIADRLPVWEDDFAAEEAPLAWRNDHGAISRADGQLVMTTPADGWAGAQSPPLWIDLTTCTNLIYKVSAIAGVGGSTRVVVKVHEYGSAAPAIPVYTNTTPGEYTVDLRTTLGWMGTRLLDVQFYVEWSAGIATASLDYVRWTP